jgi:hypothetical protein
VESLQSRFLKIKNQIEDIQKKNLLIKTTIDNTIHNIDGLITHIRNIEIQIQKNEKQPINDYERLIPDCQVSLIEFKHWK